MAPSRRNITQATVVVPNTPKGEGKTIETPEFADCHPKLFDVRISDAGDSHSNAAPPRRTQATEPEPRLDGEQLQMLSTMQEQMEDQQT